MALERTVIYAEGSDPAAIKEAAAQRAVSEAEISRTATAAPIAI
ncbi:hypothetical protein ACQP0C_34390 [Nocardia sp. CA-129566]